MTEQELCNRIFGGLMGTVEQRFKLIKDIYNKYFKL